MIEKLQYRFRRHKADPGAIEDVYDGELYKRQETRVPYLPIQQNVSCHDRTCRDKET